MCVRTDESKRTKGNEKMNEQLNKLYSDTEATPAYSPEEIAGFLDDLYLVGPHKPLGYLPLDTLEQICGVGREVMQQQLEERGLRVLIFSLAESNVWSGALYAYDERALADVLSEGESILRRTGWPLEPELFVRNLNILAEDEELYRLIMVAFSDPRLRSN